MRHISTCRKWISFFTPLTFHLSILGSDLSTKRKHCPYKPGSVPVFLLVPAIYLLRTSPCVSSVLPSIASRRNSGGQPSHGDGIHELAASSGNSTTITRCLVVSYTTFSPLLVAKRLFSSPLTNCCQLLLLSEVERPMPPGLSSRLSFQKHQRQAEAVLSDCKGTNKRVKSQILFELFRAKVP